MGALPVCMSSSPSGVEEQRRRVAPPRVQRSRCKEYLACMKFCSHDECASV